MHNEKQRKGITSLLRDPDWKVRNLHAGNFRQLFFTLILYAKACDVLTPKAYLKGYQTVKLWPQARVVYLIQHGRECSVKRLVTL